MIIKKNIFSKIGIFLSLLQLIITPSLAAAQDVSNIQDQRYYAIGKDTVAGYPTLLQSSRLPSLQDIVFEIKKPDGSVLSLPVKTDMTGMAKVELRTDQTYQAGQYLVRLVFNNTSTKATRFIVYPGQFDQNNSSLKVSRTIAKADGSDTIKVKVHLKDQYGNSLQAREVSLISDRPQDSITPENSSGLTNSSGEIIFKISSTKPGVSHLNIQDVFNNRFSQNIQVAFLDSYDHINTTTYSSLPGNNHNFPSIPDNIGGNFDFITTAYAADIGSLHHFSISDIPSTVQPNQNINFRVTAQDANNQTIENYTGKVHFSAEGTNSNNVSLPEDYIFKSEDLGNHLFSLGLSFSSAGTYKIVVTDLENPLIRGEKTVVVGSGGSNASSQQNQGSGLKPKIEIPTPGTYSQKIQTIAGTAPIGYTIKFFDNQQEIGAVQVNSDGKFSYQTTTLSDGGHKIYAVALDASQTVKGTSDSVEFSIDSTPPEIEDITLQPTSGVKAGQVITIHLTSEENLTQAVAVFNKDIIQLNPSLDKPGLYINSVQAPKESGVYPIDIILVDQLDNEAQYKAKAQVTVTANGGTANVIENTQPTQTQTQTQENVVQTQETQELLTTPPSNVSGLLSYASDKRVTLVWDSASDNSSVKHYRVYYGTDPAKLDNYADTKDASTTWYIPNLENGKEYYFAVTAFDNEEIESKDKSEVITGIPFKTETSTLPKPDTSNQPKNDNLHGSAQDDKLQQAANQSIRNHEPGPEVIWLLSGSGFISTIVYQLKRRRK